MSESEQHFVRRTVGWFAGFSDDRKCVECMNIELYIKETNIYKSDFPNKRRPSVYSSLVYYEQET